MELLPAVSKATFDCINGVKGAAGWLQGRQVSVNMPGGGQENASLTAATVAAATVVAMLKAYTDAVLQSPTSTEKSPRLGPMHLSDGLSSSLVSVHGRTRFFVCLHARHDTSECMAALGTLAVQCIDSSRLSSDGPLPAAVSCILQHATAAAVPVDALRVVLLATAASCLALLHSHEHTPSSVLFTLHVAASCRSQRVFDLAVALAAVLLPRAGAAPGPAGSAAGNSATHTILHNLTHSGELFDDVAVESSAGGAAAAEQVAAPATRTMATLPPSKLSEQLANECILFPMEQAACDFLLSPVPVLDSAGGGLAMGGYLAPVGVHSHQLLTLRTLCTRMGWGRVYRTVLPQVLWPALQAPQQPCPAALTRWEAAEHSAQAEGLARARGSCEAAAPPAVPTATVSAMCPSGPVQCARAMRCIAALLGDALANATSPQESASVLRGMNNVLARFVELLRQCAPVPLSPSDAAAAAASASLTASSAAQLPMVAASATQVQCGLPFICQLEMVCAIAQVWSAFKGSLWPSALCAHALGGGVLPPGTNERSVFDGMNDELWEGVRISYATLRQAVWGASDWCIWLPRGVRGALPAALLRCTLAPPRGAQGKVSDVQVPASMAKASGSARRPVGGAKRGGRGASGSGARGRPFKRGRGGGSAQRS